MEADVVTLQDLFVFDFKAGTDGSGRFRGTLRSTGLRPRFMEDLSAHGVTVPVDLFVAGVG
jgi:pilus assembly protein CpaF